MSENGTWECVIVGGGGAGLSAALMLGRARRRVLLLDAGEQSNRPAHGIGGLLGHDGLPPSELYARGRRELRAYPSVVVRDARVVDGARVGDGPVGDRRPGDASAADPGMGGRAAAAAAAGAAFVLTLEDGERIAADRVLLATGMTYAAPALPGLGPLWGDTVFHCPYCHGWEVRDGRLAVHGALHAVPRALLLRGWSADVVFLSDGPAELSAEDRATLQRAGVPVDERRVSGLDAADGRLRAVRFDDGSERELDGLLVAAPLVQRHDLAAGLGATFTEHGVVDVDGFGQTVVPGLYAAGDVANPMPTVANVIAEGARAAAAVNAALVGAAHGVPSMLPPREEWGTATTAASPAAQATPEARAA